MSTQAELSPARRELLRLLSGQGREIEPLVSLPKGAPRPLSLVQERMWVSERFAGRPAGGTFTASAILKGPLDVKALTAALAEIYRRHEVLRATFPAGDEPRQIILDEVVPYLPLHDLSGMTQSVRDAALMEIIDREATWKVDLGSWPLLRLTLVKLAENDHFMLFSYHHIVADGWSTGLFYSELGTLYSAFVAGRPSPLPELEIQYPDYASWQRRMAARPEFQQHLDYFKRRLTGNLPPLELPTDRPRTAARDFSAATHTFWLSGEITRGIKNLVRAEGTTPFVVLMASFLTLLSRCSGQEDLTVATPVANRSRREVEKMIGCFMHPVVLRTDLSGNPTFRELVSRVRQLWMESLPHQDAPFELVMRAIRPQWDAIHMPVFQVLFNVQPMTTGNLNLTGLQVGNPDLHVRSAALDLSVDIWVGEDRIRGDVEYSAELFDEATVAWMMRCYVSLLSKVIVDPEQRISTIPLSGAFPALKPAVSNLAVALSEKRRELLQLLAAEQTDALPGPVPAEPPRVGVHACSFGQERLWFMDRLSPDSAIYNETQIVELQGPLDVDALRRAMDEIVRRHDILRTAIRAEGARPVQVVESELPVPLHYEDLSKLSSEEQEAAYQRLIDDQAHKAFDLALPPLYRVTLVRLSPIRHLMIETVHHMIADGWSMRVFRRELAAIYRAYAAGQDSPLPELPLQYAGYARRQRTWYREAILQGQMAYWKRQLAGELPITQLPTDFPRPAGLSYGRNQAQHFALEGLDDDLERIRQDSGATPFMVMLAAFLALLHRYSGQEDLVIDTPVSGRTHSELEGLIGFFVNSLILRADLSGRPTFRELLARVSKMCLDAYANQELPFDKVVSQVQLPPERRGQPLTSVSFMLHETVAKNEALGAGVRVIPAGYDISDEFDLSFIVWQGPEGWSGDVQFDPRLFEPATAARLAGHYTTLLTSALSNPDLAIQDLTVVPEAERHRVLEEFNPATLRVPSGITLHGLFEVQAEASPRTQAVLVPAAHETTEAEQAINYSDLNRRANRLARLLIERGVGPESRVGICMHRSTDMVAAVLGVLKAGAAYVPLDPVHGTERLRYMIEDSRCRLVIAHHELLADWDLPADILELDRIENQISRQDPSNPNTPIRGDQLAYVIYTSGSTGRPK
ncbi:MAG: condensation domain-containing protein, partial [Actinomycetota bacterium]